MTTQDARATYEAGRDAAEVALRAHEAKNRAFSTARLAVAGAAIFLVAGLVWGHLPAWTPTLLAVLVAVFVALVVVHARVFAAKAREEARLRFHRRGLARLDGTWREFTSKGVAVAPPVDHPFAEDLDIFGPSSLFQLLDATETPFGRETLATALSLGAIRDDGPATVTWQVHLEGEQAAVRELAPATTWRERLSVEGAMLQADAPDPAPFLQWAEAKSASRISPVVVTLAWVLPLVLAVVVLWGQALGLPKSTWIAVVLVELAVVAVHRRSMAATLAPVSEHASAFARYAPLFAAALSEERSSPRLARVLAQLRAPGSHRGVVAEMVALERIVALVDARQNEVFRFFIAPLLMWDVHCAARLERWRDRSGAACRAWFSALGQLEAFASLAGFAFDRPDHAWPEARSSAAIAAMGLGHPLIDRARRVGNDVELRGGGTALIVTGSNMSGKSTLLRAIGVNVVLANMGAPVTATSFAFGFVSLATSMRVKDSLDEGVSHFYAELKKLKRVVDLAAHPPPVLFLLDEILHGTNSRERIIGARAVVEGLLRRGALGVVSTHDLGIADLTAALPDAVRSIHFEEQVAEDGTMTFDYRLRDGVVHGSNALRLMRAIGLDVPLEPTNTPQTAVEPTAKQALTPPESA